LIDILETTSSISLYSTVSLLGSPVCSKSAVKLLCF